MSKIDGIETSAYHVSGNRWTFQDTPVREWVLSHCSGKVANVCAGKTQLGYSGEVIRNDIDPDMPADTHLDVHDFLDSRDTGEFQTIVFDPPWSGFQSGDKYSGGNVNWTREIKEGFDRVLSDRGKVIQIGYSGSNMPAELGYTYREVTTFLPYGRRKAFVGTVTQKDTTLFSFEDNNV